MKYYVVSNLKNKIINFLNLFEKNKKVNTQAIQIKNKTFDLFGFNNHPDKEKFLVIEQEKKEEEIIINLLNYTIPMISLIINQEYEIVKLLNFQKVKNNPFLYELLYLGLKEKFLDQFDTKSLIEAFYQTNRLTKNQYLTLTKHYYLENKEYEE